MSLAFSIAFLLLSATVVHSLEDQTEEEGDFPSHLKQGTAGHHAEEILQDGGLQDLCDGCKSLVTKVKKEMGDDTSKAKIAKLVDKVCSQEDKNLVDACKKITGDLKDKLSETIASGKDAQFVCKKVKLCEKKPPPHL